MAEVESGSAGATKKFSGGGGANAAAAAATGVEPERNNDCKICQQLQKQGNTQQYKLFDNHMGEATFQCPTFMKMKMKERLQLWGKQAVPLLLGQQGDHGQGRSAG